MEPTTWRQTGSWEGGGPCNEASPEENLGTSCKSKYLGLKIFVVLISLILYSHA